MGREISSSFEQDFGARKMTERTSLKPENIDGHGLVPLIIFLEI
jgi:hypothetical protein